MTGSRLGGRFPKKNEPRKNGKCCDTINHATTLMGYIAPIIMGYVIFSAFLASALGVQEVSGTLHLEKIKGGENP